MTLQEILTRDEGQSFDRKSIRIDAKGLAKELISTMTWSPTNDFSLPMAITLL